MRVATAGAVAAVAGIALMLPSAATPQGSSPGLATVNPSTPAATGAHTATLSGTVNPQGLPTTAYFAYGLDPRYTGGSQINYDQTTVTESVGSDFTDHPLSASLNGLLPNATYHVELIAQNDAGITVGPAQAFTTQPDPPPLPPVLGASADLKPISGSVFIELPPGQGAVARVAVSASSASLRGFSPLTEASQLPDGTVIDARKGTLALTTVGRGGKLQTGVFGGAVFTVSQDKRGRLKWLTTLKLVENAFRGGPSFASCRKSKHPRAVAAKLKPKVLQTLNSHDKHGSFRTRGKHGAATVRGTTWAMSERCDGTFVTVRRGTVKVFDFRKHKTIVLHAGHSYLAR